VIQKSIKRSLMMYKQFKEVVTLGSIFVLLFFQSSLAQSSGNPDIDIVRDEMGVWYLRAPDNASLYDIYFQVGYQVATDRLWQMELYNRAATGKLAELLGQIYLENDVFIRTLGYSELELAAGFESLDKESKGIIQGYIDGINKRIDYVVNNRSQMPMEYVVFGEIAGYELLPAKWTPTDLLAWTVMLQRQFDPEALEMNHGQLENIQLLGRLMALYPTDISAMLGQIPGTTLVGQVMFHDLRWSEDPDAQTYILEEDVPDEWKPSTKRKRQVSVSLAQLPDYSHAINQLQNFRRKVKDNLERINAYVRMGSYAWVVGPEKTKDGKPIIYAGPQMGFDAPSICFECSIQGGGINVSGMMIPGIPGVFIGRTPHHAWSMQVGHAHSTDFYFDFDSSKAILDRFESIAIAGGSSITISVFKIDGRPVLRPSPFNPQTYVPSQTNPLVSWRYANIGHEFNMVSAMLDLARSQSIEEFGQGIEKMAFSQHFCYADKDGNIAYWMSGRDPVRPDDFLGLSYQLPQGVIPGVPQMDWNDNILKPRSHLVNPSRHYFAGWNNKSHPYYSGSPNNINYFTGPFHRSHVIYDYLDSHNDLTYENIRDLAIRIATTESIGKAGNPWPFVKDIFSGAVLSNPSSERQEALSILDEWDGHFVDGGKSNWASGKDRSDGWMLMDTWIKKVIEKTFSPYLNVLSKTDESNSESDVELLFGNEYQRRLLNVIIRSFKGRCNYDWFNNIMMSPLPESAQAMQSKAFRIIVEALDESISELGERPWGINKRGTIKINHSVVTNLKSNVISQIINMPDSPIRSYLLDLLSSSNLWEIPFANRSTYAQCVEFSSGGPTRIESFFPMGQSAYIDRQFLYGMINDPQFKIFLSPHLTDFYHKHFFDMSIKYFDNFEHRPFPLFERITQFGSGRITSDILGYNAPIAGVVVKVLATDMMTTTDIDGRFSFTNILLDQSYTIQLESAFFEETSYQVNFSQYPHITQIQLNKAKCFDRKLTLEDAIEALQCVAGKRSE
jgi:penicillin amidase